MSKLDKMSARAKAFLAKHPERTVQICDRALAQEQQLLIQEGKRIKSRMDSFRRLRREAKARMANRAQDTGIPAPRKAQEPRKGQAMRGTPGVQVSGSRTRRLHEEAALSSEERRQLARMLHGAQARVSQDPVWALKVCDKALGFLEDKRRATALRKEFQLVRLKAAVRRRELRNR